jgi:hypothetical protein
VPAGPPNPAPDSLVEPTGATLAKLRSTDSVGLELHPDVLRRNDHLPQECCVGPVRRRSAICSVIVGGLD